MTAATFTFDAGSGKETATGPRRTSVGSEKEGAGVDTGRQVEPCSLGNGIGNHGLEAANDSRTEEATRVLTVTVDRPAAWLFECAARVVRRMSGATSMDQVLEALLAEGWTTLLAGPWGNAVTELVDDPWEAAQRAWEKQRAEWRERAEVLCEPHFHVPGSRDGDPAMASSGASRRSGPITVPDVCAPVTTESVTVLEGGTAPVHPWQRMEPDVCAPTSTEGSETAPVHPCQRMEPDVCASPTSGDSRGARNAGVEDRVSPASNEHGPRARAEAPSVCAPSKQRERGDDPMPSVEQLDGRIRDLAAEMARRDVELGRLLQALHEADAWRRLGYATETQYARERLGMSRSSLHAKRALATRLRRLPRIAGALEARQLGHDAETYRFFKSLERAFARTPHGPTSLLRFLAVALIETWAHSLQSDVRYEAVYARDRYRCTSPVCNRSDVTPHHLRFRSQGGVDESDNLTSLCVWCHLEGVHGGRLRAEPPASSITWRIGRRVPMAVTGRRRVAA